MQCALRCDRERTALIIAFLSPRVNYHFGVEVFTSTLRSDGFLILILIMWLEAFEMIKIFVCVLNEHSILGGFVKS